MSQNQIQNKGQNRGPAVVTVCNDKQYERLRHLIYSIRETQKYTGEIYVLDCGLTNDQVEILAWNNIRVVKIIRDTPDEVQLPQAFLHKAFADLYVPANDPILVVDNDIEFQGKGILDELLEIAGRKMVIAEEVYGWISNLNIKYELTKADGVARAFLDPQANLLTNQPIVNAGLFGGPRKELHRFLSTARLMIPGLIQVYHWFWEQMAFNYIVRLNLFDVHLLSTEMNWITNWGKNPDAKIVHFCGGNEGFMGNKLRQPMPGEYLFIDPYVTVAGTPEGIELAVVPPSGAGGKGGCSL